MSCRSSPIDNSSPRLDHDSTSGTIYKRAAFLALISLTIISLSGYFLFFKDFIMPQRLILTILISLTLSIIIGFLSFFIIEEQ
jgi:hypothetical protein